MDRLAGPEFEAPAGDADDTAPSADEVHLDAAVRFVVERTVGERVEVEIGPHLAIDACQQVEIELCGVPLGIVVGAIQDRSGLVQIHADQRRAALPRLLTRPTQEVQRLAGLEVADGRTGEKDHFATSRERHHIQSVRMKVRADRDDLQPAVFARQGVRFLQQLIERDVDGDIAARAQLR